MNIYPILVFIHVLGGVGIFAALGIEAVALARLRRADTPAEARAWMGLMAVPARLGPIAMLANLATGVWMMVQSWGPLPWMQAAMVAVVVMAAAGGGVTGRRAKRLRAALGEETGPALSAGFRALRSSVALAASLRLRIALATGIIGLMTMKPGAAGSLVIAAVAVVAGLVAGVALGTNRAAVARHEGVRP
jgi:hypothetical protein